MEALTPGILRDDRLSGYRNGIPDYGPDNQVKACWRETKGPSGGNFDRIQEGEAKLVILGHITGLFSSRSFSV